MARCWMAEGFSKPKAYTPRSRASRMPMPSKLLITFTPLLVSKDSCSSSAKLAGAPLYVTITLRESAPTSEQGARKLFSHLVRDVQQFTRYLETLPSLCG